DRRAPDERTIVGVAVPQRFVGDGLVVVSEERRLPVRAMERLPEGTGGEVHRDVRAVLRDAERPPVVTRFTREIDLVVATWAADGIRVRVGPDVAEEHPKAFGIGGDPE